MTPDDLERALTADPTARRAWDELPVSHRREYLDWIGEAKKPETRAKRIERAVERLGS